MMKNQYLYTLFSFNYYYYYHWIIRKWDTIYGRLTRYIFLNELEVLSEESIQSNNKSNMSTPLIPRLSDSLNGYQYVIIHCLNFNLGRQTEDTTVRIDER